MGVRPAVEQRPPRPVRRSRRARSPSTTRCTSSCRASSRRARVRHPRAVPRPDLSRRDPQPGPSHRRARADRRAVVPPSFRTVFATRRRLGARRRARACRGRRDQLAAAPDARRLLATSARFRGDVNDIPILMVDGFFDVESRGAFQAFQELRDDGAHLLVSVPTTACPPEPAALRQSGGAWYDRYLRDVDNGIEDDPRSQLWLADGDREDMLAGSLRPRATATTGRCPARSGGPGARSRARAARANSTQRRDARRWGHRRPRRPRSIRRCRRCRPPPIRRPRRCWRQRSLGFSGNDLARASRR